MYRLDPAPPKVEDINDNRPIFVGLPYNFVFNSDAEKGTPISKVQAVDMDVGMNGQVSYSVVSGDPTSLFAVNAKTGALSIARNVDADNDLLNHTLLVMARDMGTSAFAWLLVAAQVFTTNFVFPRRATTGVLHQHHPAHGLRRCASVQSVQLQCHRQ